MDVQEYLEKWIPRFYAIANSNDPRWGVACQKELKRVFHWVSKDNITKNWGSTSGYSNAPEYAKEYLRLIDVVNELMIRFPYPGKL